MTFLNEFLCVCTHVYVWGHRKLDTKYSFVCVLFKFLNGKGDEKAWKSDEWFYRSDEMMMILYVKTSVVSDTVFHWKWDVRFDEKSTSMMLKQHYRENFIRKHKFTASLKINGSPPPLGGYEYIRTRTELTCRNEGERGGAQVSKS